MKYILLIILVCLVWLSCGVVAGGLSMGYFNCAFPELKEDRVSNNIPEAIGLTFAGPLGLAGVSLFLWDQENADTGCYYDGRWNDCAECTWEWDWKW